MNDNDANPFAVAARAAARPAPAALRSINQIQRALIVSIPATVIAAGIVAYVVR